MMPPEARTEHPIMNHRNQQQVPATGQNKGQGRPQLQLRSRLPTASGDASNEAASLPILSPRTPMVIDPNFFPLAQGANNDMQSAMAALDLYGQNMFLEDPEQGSGYVNDPPYQQSYQNISRESQYSEYLKPGRGTNDVQLDQSASIAKNTQNIPNLTRPSPQPSPQPLFSMVSQSSCSMTHVNDLQRQNQLQSHVPVNIQRQNMNQHSQHDNNEQHENQDPQGEKKPKQQLTSVRQQASSPVSKRTSLRKHTVSLNPEERESLEKLIDEVLQQGFSEDFNDSDSSDTDTEGPVSPNSVVSNEGQDKKKNGGNAKEKKAGGKQPSTLKVAAKHMKNIPPRFLKKLQAIQSSGKPEEDGVTLTDENIALIVNGVTVEDVDTQINEEKLSPRLPNTDQVQQQFTASEKKNNLGENKQVRAEVASPPQAYMPSPIIQAPMPLSCEELERNLLGSVPKSPGTAAEMKPEMNFPKVNQMEGQNQAIGRNPPLTPDTVDRRYLEAMRENLDRKTGFSVNAPEFVPKSQRPGMPGDPVPTSSPPVALPPVAGQPFSLLAGVHAGGRFSPQTTRLQASKTPDRNTPSPGAPFIVSKGPQIQPVVTAATAGGVPIVPPYQPPPAYPVHHYVHPYHGNIYRQPFITAHPYQEPKQANLVAHYQGAHMFMPQGVPPGAKIPGKDKNWAQMMQGMRPGAGGNLGIPRMPTSPQLSARQDLHNQAQKLRQKVYDLIKAGKKVMIIIRGLPGSGKSTLARLETEILYIIQTFMEIGGNCGILLYRKMQISFVSYLFDGIFVSGN